MSSILTAIFKSTIGLLVTKARDKTAESLKDGDVADQAFRNLIVREIDDIKTKLNGLARKDFLASTEHFKAGILNLNQVFEKSFACLNEISEGAAATAENTSALATSHVTEQIQNLQPTDLNESAKKSLADATERFKLARTKAIDAFSNEALSTSDRILALKIQLMATILERVDRPADALDECRLCLENLHAMPAVRDNFKVQLRGGARSLLNRTEREAIFVCVYQMNEVVFRVTQIIKGKTFAGESIRLPYLQVNDESIDVLRDVRVVEKLLKLDLADLFVSVQFWSFDLDFRAEHIATNTRDQTFIVADLYEINVYNSSGRFLYTVEYPSEVDQRVEAIATDRDGNLYALLELSESRHVYVWDQHGNFQQSYPVTNRSFCRSLAINDNNQVFVLTYHVTVYNTQGTFLHEFGGRILKFPEDIAAASDGRVMVLDQPDDALCRVHTFSANGDHLQKFTPRGVNDFCSGSITFDRSSEALVVVLWTFGFECGKVSIYTKDGKFLREVPEFDEEGVRQVAVTSDGHLAIVSYDKKVRVGEWENLFVR